jgi:hypothetical protein
LSGWTRKKTNKGANLARELGFAEGGFDGGNASIHHVRGSNNVGAVLKQKEEKKRK